MKENFLEHKFKKGETLILEAPANQHGVPQEFVDFAERKDIDIILVEDIKKVKILDKNKKLWHDRVN